MKQILEYIISLIPHIRKWRAVFLKHSYPGHFYSPIPDLDWINQRKEIVFKKEKIISGIAMNDNVQLEYVDRITTHINNFPFPKKKQSNYLFYNNNNYYTNSDAICLYGMLLFLKPNKVVEIGSGFSSSLMIDVNRIYFNSKIELVFIEPNPKRFLSVVGKNSNDFKLIENYIQNVDLELFRSLERYDILFIDSSHVSKTDSDLNFIIFEILPLLKTGVIIHFHDIFYPFEYPETWIQQRYAWNEAYILRSLLMYTTRFDIILMNTYLAEKYSDNIPKSLSVINKDGLNSGSIWLSVKVN